MNILPLILILALVFGGLALTFIRDTKSFFLLERSFEGHHRTERLVHNRLAQKAYRKTKGKSVKTNNTESSSSSPKQTSFQSRRQYAPPFENSKCNLAPLFELDQDLKQHPLYESIAILLHLLYGKNLFAKQKHEDLEYKILDALLAKAGSLETITDLSALTPDNKALQPLYYKMLKGTNQYNETQGYPPLGDFFSIHSDQAPIYLSFASPALLEALFGKEIKEAILRHEEEAWNKEHKYVYFSKEDLQALVNQIPGKAPPLSLLEPLINGSKQFAPRTELSGMDHISGMTVRKPIESVQ